MNTKNFYNSPSHQPIGILGGTFDPIHLGHLYLALMVQKQCNLQKIMFLPCYQSPLRKTPHASSKDRLEMLNLAIKDFPCFSINDYEIKQPKPSYAFETLVNLRSKITQTPLCWIMGFDAFCNFNKWYRWKDILALTNLIIANRPNSPTTINQELTAFLATHQITNPALLEQNLAGKIYFTDIKPMPISSSKIRDDIQANQNPYLSLTKEVWQYIRQHNLYNNQQ